MKRLPTVTIALVSSALMISFNNCSKVAVQSSGETSSLGNVDNGGGEDLGIVTIQKKCNNSLPASKIVQVNFPAPTQSCAWGVGGNSGKRDSYFQARTEQEVDFVLPPGATICDLDFKFQKQEFYYDDHIILTLNDRILASSYNWKDLLSKDQNDLRVYDWSKIVTKDWNDSAGMEGVFCAGQDQGLASCQWPNTQVAGDISMSFDKSIIQKVMASSAGVSKHVFKFITTGDNDGDIDCWHKAIQFDVTVKYVEAGETL